VLYNFSSEVGLGYALTVDENGALYGATTPGSNSLGCNTVYQLSPPAMPGAAWRFTVIYAFSGTDGCPNPTSVTFYKGALYGVADGGADNLGMVFQLAPPAAGSGEWAMTILHSFTGGSDGSYPDLPVVFDSDGNLFGADEAELTGQIYELTPPAVAGGTWTESGVYTFPGGSGGTGPSDLVSGTDGKLYGTSYNGGIAACDNSGCGFVFALSPPADAGDPWILSDLYNFTGGAGGGSPGGPYALTFGAGGIIYGSTGTTAYEELLFQLTPGDSGWTFEIIEQFAGGALPVSVVPGSKGNLFVAPFTGYDGEILELSPPSLAGGAWVETVIFNLGAYGNGGSPAANLVFDSQGTIYGTTSGGGFPGPCFGGTYPGCGIVFRLTPPAAAGQAWNQTVLYRFLGGNDGAAPESGVVIDQNGVLYGAASRGGSLNKGVVFSLAPPTEPRGSWTETVIHAFGGAGDGVFPTGPLVFDDSGALYGTTAYGGLSTPATVFKLTPPVAPGAAWTASSVYSFTGGYYGPYPIGVTFHGGVLYGVTSSAQHGVGTVFQLTPPAAGGAWTETVLHTFAGGSDGLAPYGTLIFDANGALYGTTASGGGSSRSCENGCGVVFQLTPPAAPGGAWTENLIFDFSTDLGSAGYNPTGVAFSNGALYGTTCSGVLFELTPQAAGGAWPESTLASFSDEQGRCPQGLTLNSGLLYGTAGSGGIGSGFGTVYQVAP
jgi:hypothetical protein